MARAWRKWAAPQRKRIIGTRKEYPTESAARKAIEALRLDINAEFVRENYAQGVDFLTATIFSLSTG